MRLRRVAHRISGAAVLALVVATLTGTLAPLLPSASVTAATLSTATLPASCGDAPARSCNATVQLFSTVACGLPPVVSGEPASPVLTLGAPWSYSINATQFCGTSMFYNYTSTGLVRAYSYGPGNGSGRVLVAGNGTATANYITEPVG